jgi:hypothetical protein
MNISSFSPADALAVQRLFVSTFSGVAAFQDPEHW